MRRSHHLRIPRNFWRIDYRESWVPGISRSMKKHQQNTILGEEIVLFVTASVICVKLPQSSSKVYSYRPVGNSKLMTMFQEISIGGAAVFPHAKTSTRRHFMPDGRFSLVRCVANRARSGRIPGSVSYRPGFSSQDNSLDAPSSWGINHYGNDNCELHLASSPSLSTT